MVESIFRRSDLWWMKKQVFTREMNFDWWQSTFWRWIWVSFAYGKADLEPGNLFSIQ